ncbi:putative lipoprotein [Pseudomonas sp. M47T1]|uniref:ABC-type transport auxiliary lipoprotein family protein n=1 Tax=Pseudomonas sp. M47T1 TaxID=1179778 RepID=UPI0002606762|nr:ABC-type transport auxiliary lipoprotein family protein [Pseudomonas sp. M47T1]EIK97602.1 putative lipoprotein [Pseudomonas sp. M47T1]
MSAALRRLAAGLVCVLLPACSILPKAEPADVYRLPVATQAASPHNGPSLARTLRIGKPQASDALNSPRIAVVPQGDLISSYKGARWSDPAPVLLRNRLLDGFISDGRLRGVSNDDANVQGDLELGGELQAFQSEYAAGGVTVRVRLDARLVDGRSQRIVASRRFEVSQPVSGTSVANVVAGFGQASDRLTAQVIDWTLAQAAVAPKNQ